MGQTEMTRMDVFKKFTGKIIIFLSCNFIQLFFIGLSKCISFILQNPKRAEFQALLSWCLDTASGFYLMLLQEICAAFNLDLPFRR